MSSTQQRIFSKSVALGLSSPAQRRRETARRAVEGARAVPVGVAFAESDKAPTTMLRMFPLPRCTGEDAQEPRVFNTNPGAPNG
jgi:hypothetical protein